VATARLSSVEALAPKPGATWANACRYTGWLSFAYKRFDGCVPEPGVLDAEDRALLAQIEAGFQPVDEPPPLRPGSDLMGQEMVLLPSDKNEKTPGFGGKPGVLTLTARAPAAVSAR
jgi:hypothetical protein